MAFPLFDLSLPLSYFKGFLAQAYWDLVNAVMSLYPPRDVLCEFIDFRVILFHLCREKSPNLPHLSPDCNFSFIPLISLAALLWLNAFMPFLRGSDKNYAWDSKHKNTSALD